MRDTKLVLNCGEDVLELEQLEDGIAQTYSVQPGEALPVPLSDDDVAAQSARADEPTEALQAPKPEGVVGWQCQQIVGAICAHEACSPKAVTAAVEAELAAIADDAPAL